MSDLISRQDAIYALLEKGQRSRRYRIGDFWELNFDEIREALATVPSAEPQWIPVSENPVTPGLYIVTLKDGKGLFTDTAEWNPTFGGRWQCVFYDDDAIGEYHDISNVVAWMPLPEPYEEAERKEE